MPVPLIVVLPAKGDFDSALRRWAAQGGTALSDDDLAKLLPPAFAAFARIDRTYPAVPVGKERKSGVAPKLEMLSPADFEVGSSETFAVRIFADVNTYADLAHIPFESGGKFVFADARIASFALPTSLAPPTDFQSRAVGGSAAVKRCLRAKMLHDKGLDGRGVAIAIMDGGINRGHLEHKLGVGKVACDAGRSWTPPHGRAPFDYPADHGTMCAFDALLAAPKATLLDYPILFNLPTANRERGSTVKSLLSGALPGFTYLLLDWARDLLRGRSLVASNSWGIHNQNEDFPEGHPSRYVDNPFHPFNLLLSALTYFGADIVFAAGNSGAEVKPQPIMGSAALGKVLAIAGCDTHDCLVSYSSRGPGIDGMAKRKPDVTAYTHFHGSSALGRGTPDKGTSAACPVAAGCVAALRTINPPGRRPSPEQLIETIQKTARQVASPGWNEKFGYGIIDPVAAAQSLLIYPPDGPSTPEA
jgi:subtilisin family serine protease